MSDNCLPIHSSSFTGDTGCCSKKELTVSETDLYFQLSLDGTRTPAQWVDVTNTGKANVQIKKVVLTRGGGDFIIVNNNAFPSVLKRGESFRVIVDFTARVDGKTLGLLEIYTNEDRLPYVLGLQSRVRLPDEDEEEPSNASIRDLYIRLAKEIRLRASEDVRITAEITAAYGLKLGQETSQRVAADTLEATARSTEDAALRALAQSLTNTEAGIRYAADQDILRRLGLVEANQNNGTVFGVDGEARASIVDERIVRANADLAEAIARQTLEASFNTAISAANAKIVEESKVYSDRYEALASKTLNIEATYQTAGQVQTIADARLRTEQTARATAISAETTARQQQIASLNTLIKNGLDNEKITREASILIEQNARLSLEQATAQNLSRLTARMSNARGLVQNATFAANRPNWDGFTFVTNGTLGFLPSSEVGKYNQLTYTDYIPIDPARAYQINVLFDVITAAAATYVGMMCFAVDGTFLGNIYAPSAAGQALLGTQIVSSIFTGTVNVPVPSFYAGKAFPTGTRSVRPILVANYPNSQGVSVPGSQTRVSYFWLDDITNSYSNTTALAEFSLATSTEFESLTTKLSIAESNFTTVKGRVDGLDKFVGETNIAIIAANSRITLEENTRANALAAEATRVDKLLANFESGGAIEAKINAAIIEEQKARATAIEAEASRVNTLLVNYVTGTALNTRFTSEITARDTAIANAVSAEATRVNGIFASYTTTDALNNKFSAEITNRDNAIATAVSAEASRVDAVIASLDLGGDVDSKITAAINAERQVRVNAEGAISKSLSEVKTTADGASSNASIALEAANSANTSLGNARIRLKADNGSGRAQVDIYSDVYGNSGVDLTGAVRILGSNGGNILTLDNNQGFSMTAPNGVRFVELGVFS